MLIRENSNFFEQDWNFRDIEKWIQLNGFGLRAHHEVPGPCNGRCEIHKHRVEKGFLPWEY